MELFYWRERGRKVDFVLRAGLSVTAFEVKSGRSPAHLPGTDAFLSLQSRPSAPGGRRRDLA